MTDAYTARIAGPRTAEPGSTDDRQPDENFHREICACDGRLASTLKPEYAEVLQAVDVEDTSVKVFAGTAGLAAFNAVAS